MAGGVNAPRYAQVHGDRVSHNTKLVEITQLSALQKYAVSIINTELGSSMYRWVRACQDVAGVGVLQSLQKSAHDLSVEKLSQA